MNADPESVIEQIDASLRVLEDMDRLLAEQTLPGVGGPAPDRVKRIVIAQILENTFTAIETALLRISQGFDNSLDAHRWHSDLLTKMTIAKNGIRPRVLSDETFGLLTELMRFRHFKRYYLELDYDWEKLHYLLSVRRRCLPRLREELASFKTLVKRGLPRG